VVVEAERDRDPHPLQQDSRLVEENHRTVNELPLQRLEDSVLVPHLLLLPIVPHLHLLQLEDLALAVHLHQLLPLTALHLHHLLLEGLALVVHRHRLLGPTALHLHHLRPEDLALVVHLQQLLVPTALHLHHLRPEALVLGVYLRQLLQPTPRHLHRQLRPEGLALEELLEVPIPQRPRLHPLVKVVLVLMPNLQRLQPLATCPLYQRHPPRLPLSKPPQKHSLLQQPLCFRNQPSWNTKL
jgi:hypothetical protein